MALLYYSLAKKSMEKMRVPILQVWSPFIQAANCLDTYCLNLQIRDPGSCVTIDIVSQTLY